MKYKLFGKSGLRVSELCLGTANFGQDVYGPSKEECHKIIDAFAEAGGNFLDSADVYGAGTSEEIVGELIKVDRQYFVVSTKYTVALREGDPNYCGNHRKYMMKALEESLRRLNTEYIDIYWVHMWDFATPIDEVMRALDDAVRAGKILYIGISNTPAWIVAQANIMAELRGWNPVVGIQVQYNLMRRTPERELIPMARQLGMAVTCWQPFGGCFLAGDPQETEFRRSFKLFEEPSERDLAISTAVVDMAEEIGCKPAQIALNWLRQKNALNIPIIGTRKVEHVKENLGCLELTLMEEQMQRLDALTKIELGYPRETLDKAIPSVFGGKFSLIDNPRRGVFNDNELLR